MVVVVLEQFEIGCQPFGADEIAPRQTFGADEIAPRQTFDTNEVAPRQTFGTDEIAPRQTFGADGVQRLILSQLNGLAVVFNFGYVERLTREFVAAHHHVNLLAVSEIELRTCQYLKFSCAVGAHHHPSRSVVVGIGFVGNKGVLVGQQAVIFKGNSNSFGFFLGKRSPENSQ